MIYASLNAATAVLEKLAHLKPAQCAFEIVVGSMPAALLGTTGELPVDWREYPYRKSVQRTGDAWLQERRALAIFVPNAIMQCERNVLIDSNHPELSCIEGVDSFMYRLDGRLRR